MKKARNNAVGKGGKTGWLFLAIVVLIYGISAVVDWELTRQSLNSFSLMAGKVAPALALVFVLIFITDLFISPKRIKKYLGKQSGWKGWLIAIGAGILSTGPIYAWYALLADLKQQGMRSALMVALLYSRAVKLPLLPLMIHYFGVGYTLLLCLYLIGFAIVSGAVMQSLEDKGVVSD